MNDSFSAKHRFKILVAMVAISGFTQGMLMPLLAIIFEQDGVSSSLNGLHATGLYLGMLLAAPFMEAPLHRYGYKPIILFGGLTVVLSLALFPLWKSIWFWFVLRLLIGIGNNMLHFGSQTWITAFSPKNKRGRNIAIYGLFFGLGFGAGPIMTRLLEIHEALPFMISAGLSLVVWFTLLFLKNEYPEQEQKGGSFFSTFSRFSKVWKYAWIAFLFPFSYGFLEASLNGNFPVYALRIGIDLPAVSIILPAFAIGSTVFQLPLGVLSDRFGRRNILFLVTILGFLSFTAAGLVQASVIGLFICLFIAGMFVGSTYSLGISYMVDLVPKQLLPAGNILASILFSLGSISGPFIGGLTIQYLKGISFFYTISVMLLVIFIALLISVLGASRKRDVKDAVEV
ncbi:MFS transporter [Neobacillus kokaensis]|uniref:MFS-type transporter YfkF n=1 Tax=Neobacillus kokaensis TaxID=2759023 RepID=A0ABQ3NB35_9BACI|nr:MFS transporter [Neobacillus kokaensis]GHI01130.1 putative MFS-type transporter YfkF [Neobacillus kokaensis]